MAGAHTARRADWKIYGLLALAAILVAVLVPRVAEGTHGDPAIVPGGVVLLDMGNGPTADRITYTENTNTTVQAVNTAKNDCTFVDASLTGSQPLLVFATDVGNLFGEAKDHIGVRSPTDGYGENCVRTAADKLEWFSVELGSDFDLTGVKMGGFDIDIQLKFDSDVDAEIWDGGNLLDTIPLPEGIKLGLSDNGPDSDDNYRWAYVAPAGGQFTKVVFRATSGTFSLGGGRNATEDGIFVADKASQFAIGPVFSGEITCGDEYTVLNPAFPGLEGDIKLHSMETEGAWSTSDCPRKPFLEDLAANSLLFVPELDGTTAHYTMTLTIPGQVVDSDTTAGSVTYGQVTEFYMEYTPDPLGGVAHTALQECAGQPLLDESDQVAYDTFWNRGDVGLLPSGEMACYYFVSVMTTGVDGLDTIGTEVWGIYFKDDPGLSWR